MVGWEFTKITSTLKHSIRIVWKLKKSETHWSKRQGIITWIKYNYAAEVLKVVLRQFILFRFNNKIKRRLEEIYGTKTCIVLLRLFGIPEDF